MGPLFRTFPRLLLGALLVCSLAACETKQELQTRMDDISGEYRIAQVQYGMTDYVNSIPDEELAYVKARIYPDGEDWIVEYPLPLLELGMHASSHQKQDFTYHQIHQRVIWDRELGMYLFSRLGVDDLPGGGYEPDMIRVGFQSKSFYFHHKNYRVSWIKE